MQKSFRVGVSMPCALALALTTARCGVGGIGQTTASPVQPTQSTQQQASTGTTTSAGNVGDTTGAVDPGAGATTGDAGTTTAGVGATTAEPTTAGQATAGATTAGTTGSTTGGDGNTTTAQNGNDTLFDLSKLQQLNCYYDANKGTFAFALSNDAQFCAHGVAGVRMMQDHDLVITGDVSAQTSKANANNTNDTVLAQPTNIKATLSLYSASCALQASATSLMGSVTLTKADSTGCTGSFNLSMEQTLPTLGASPTTLTGTFSAAPVCATLGSNTSRTKCQ